MLSNKAIISALGLALIAATASASPDEYERHEYYEQRGPMPFAAMDLNRDGVVTAQEHAQVQTQRRAARAQQGYPMRHAPSAPGFAQLDTDGDGAVSSEEFAAHQAQRMQQRRGMGGPWGQ